MMARLALGLIIFLASSLLGRMLLLADIGWRDPWTGLVEWVLVFPFRLYLGIYPMLRQPGYDDIQFGACRVPHCDTWSVLVVAAISVLAYGLLAHLALALRDRYRSRRRA